MALFKSAITAEKESSGMGGGTSSKYEVYHPKFLKQIIVASMKRLAEHREQFTTGAFLILKKDNTLFDSMGSKPGEHKKYTVK